jgi:thiol-disulfide isomerase/thioredoxin
MRHIALASVLLFSAGLGIVLSEEPSSPRAQKLAKLIKKFESDEKDLKKKLADAKDPEDKQQIGFLTKELYFNAATDALDLAEENKKDETGLEAAVFTIKMLGKARPKCEEMDKSIAIIMNFHIDNPKIAPVLGVMSEMGQAGLSYLESIVEKAMNKEVLAIALYYNAVSENAKANAAEGPTGDPQKIAVVRTRAAEMMDKAVKLAPDVKVGEITLAKAVEAEIAAQRLAIGKEVPEAEGVNLDGKKIKLGSMKGKVVLLDFWATWCPPCRGMIPHEREMVAKMANKPFVLLSTSVDEEKSTLTEFLDTEKMPWSHWWDGAQGPLAKMFRVNAYPTLYLIDAKGVLRNKWIGAPGNEVLDKAVEELVTEAEKEKK